MRPTWIIWVVVVSFFFIGIFFIAKPVPEVTFFGPFWIVSSLAMGAYYLNMNRRADLVGKLRSTGLRGSAQILEMTQTGSYVNDQPRVKLKLRIEAAGVAPFEDEKTWTVPLIALGNLSGGSLTVYLKPEDHHDYVIDWGGASPGPGPITVQSAQGGAVGLGASPQATQKVLDVLKEHGVDTMGGSVDLRDLPAARAAVLKTLEDHGIDAAHQAAVADPAIPIDAQGEPLERLAKLEQLRTAGLITAEEYDSYRKGILDDV